MAAAPIHIGRLSASRAGRVLRALGRVMTDSEQTGEIVVGEEITGQAQLRYWVKNGIFDEGEGIDLLRDRPEIAELDLAPLRDLSDGTLGREFARFLDDNEIQLEGLAQPTPYTEGDAEAYLMRRIRQCHDLWHVLAGLGTAGHQEVLVHCFSIAQTGLPFSLIVISMGSLKHMVLEGRWRVLTHETRQAYRSGRDASPLLTAYWERRWSLPLSEVRKEFGILPMNASA
jgi:ubiquinone biosynthesis protein COQ4